MAMYAMTGAGAMGSDVRTRALQEMRAQGIAAPEVEIMGSCLYLRGRASCYRMKATAGVAVAGVARGFEVINELRVAHETDSDPGVIKAVQDSIRRAVPGAAARIAVISNDGDVFLRGRSTDDSERARIEVAAWEAPGVMHVHNEIEVPHEPTSDDEYARDLSRYLRRMVTVRDGDLRVGYAGGVVSLEGAVPSREQLDAIEELVGWHPGVTSVQNNLHVVALHTV